MEATKSIGRIVFLLLVALFVFRVYSAFVKYRAGKIGTSTTKKLSEFRGENLLWCLVVLLLLRMMGIAISKLIQGRVTP